MSVVTNSGIPGVGAIPWGTHFCQFYDTAGDLADTLVPYFKAGLDGGERCLWITSEPFTAAEARIALGAVVPDLGHREHAGQIEIVDYQDWYARGSGLNTDTVLKGWLDRTHQAVSQGYVGLRITGNAFWVERHDWESFTAYETEVSARFQGHPIVAMCSYCFDRCHPAGVVDVVRSHQFAVVRRQGTWELLESGDMRQAKAELAKLNAELESRVLEQTAALRESVAHKDVLLREVHHRVKNNLQVICTLLELRGHRLQDVSARQHFEETAQRVRAIGLVHEALYQTDNGNCVDFSDYLGVLSTGLLQSFGMSGQVAVHVGSSGGCLDLNTAIPLGLIATEIISNALKHAFPNGHQGRIDIAFEGSCQGLRLEIRDDGVGMTVAAPSSGIAGLGLVQALAEQLDANTSIGPSEKGTLFRLER
ncbi:MEDS domain-containing protein [Azospirillum sp. CT11-132]|uniref:MEDS domain-containing protein n=1 Tax=Azospirillum sp. CT11-132 TaxID=3396317 RepID=UPI0039A73629